MKYMGSKARFAKELIPIMLSDRKPDQWYVEPFCGGCNVIDSVDGNRLANDINPYLIDMWKALVYRNWMPPKVTRELYEIVRDSKESFAPYVVGWVGFQCSYRGKYFGGFAGETKTKIGTIRDYQSENIRNVFRQIPNLKGVVFRSGSYIDLEVPPNSIIYCDPPYRGTTEYNETGFDYNAYWGWIRYMSKEGHTVYVSEYAAPDDFECIWSKRAVSTLSANGKIGGNKESIERLFKLREVKKP